jgi:hypothetical protein
MRLRKLVGTTAGALVLGALSVPMTISSAHAAPATATAAFDGVCKYGGFSVPVKGALAVTVDGTQVDATIDAKANFNSASPALKINKLGMDMTLLIDSESVPVTGTTTFTPPAAGNADMPIPAMKGTRTATTHPATFDVTAAKLVLDISFGKADAPCTITDIAPVSFPAPPKALSFTCSTFGTSYAYNTDLALTAQARADGKIAVAATMDDMPNTAPPAVTLLNQTFDATLVTDLGDLKGSRNGDFKGGVALPIPALAGSMTGSGGSMTVSVKSFTLAVPDADVTIPCTLPAARAFTVDVTPLSTVCTDAIAGLPGAQSASAAATAAATAESGKINTANGAVAAAKASVAKSSASVKKANSAVKKANKAVKKANKAVKKAKSKAKKAKAKKAVTKAKKAVTKKKKDLAKAKTALAGANAQARAANAQLSAAQASVAAANAKAATAAAAVTALQNTIKSC